ncbi:oxidoreductase [Enemella evansiae]|uniref:FMN reductase n=1 Tax=Enemella evansiae TaxID=2016499 RepID=UPI000B97BC24|nr:FMN reductase [Enemella evansiae]OYO20492.1 oxidoreductase [Enemella evansiae]
MTTLNTSKLNTPKLITVVSAGLRSPSSSRLLADEIATAVTRLSGERVEVRHVEVRDHAHAIADALLTGFPTGQLKTDLESVREADALVMVSPTFQASVAGLFKSFIDLVEPDSLRGTPVLLAATGGSERHSLVIDQVLRPIFAYLGAVTVPTGVYAATGDFGGEYASTLSARIERAAGELVTLAGLSGDSSRSVRRAPVDDFDEVTPFENLLAGVQR